MAWTQIFQFIFRRIFPLFMSFLLFVFVVFVFKTQPVMVAEPYRVISQSGRDSLLRAVWFYPGPWLGDPIQKKKASWKIQLKRPSRWRGLTSEDALSVLKNVFHPHCWAQEGSCQHLLHLHSHVLHRELLRRKMASALKGVSQLVVIFLRFFVLHFKKGESTYKWTFQNLFLFDGYKGYKLTWMGYFPPSYSV